MKYLNPISNLLMESIESYQWELISDTDTITQYNFYDLVDNKYLVQFKSLPGLKGGLSTSWELTYFVKSDDGSYSVSKLVNVNPYRTLKTVFGDILNDFIKIKSWVKIISLEGLSKEREREYISQRTKMYVRYLERNPISGYRLSHYNNNISLIKL